jgi:hypothetical protein
VIVSLVCTCRSLLKLIFLLSLLNNYGYALKVKHSWTGGTLVLFGCLDKWG